MGPKFDKKNNENEINCHIQSNNFRFLFIQTKFSRFFGNESEKIWFILIKLVWGRINSCKG